ncbi:MAG: extracellular solute-binding protein [Butyrivibrio sp.]|nr:extracellular solute-binding protein [Butyrivibrio sp.]
MKIKTNKIIAEVLAGLLCVASLAGCGSADTADTAQSDTAEVATTEAADTAADTTEENSDASLVMAWWGNQVRNERTQQALDLYKEREGVSVEGQFNQWNDYWQKLATDSAGDSLPDVLQMDYSYIDQYVNSEQLLDLTPYIESGALDVSNIPDNVVDMGRIGDGIYGIPSGVTGSCIFYNKTACEEAGVDIHQNMTLDEFIEAAKTMKEKTGLRVRLEQGGQFLTDWLRGRGTPFTEAKLPVGEEELTEYFQILTDGIADGWHMTPDLMTSTGTEDDPLIYGSSPETMAWAVSSGSSNMLTGYQSAAPEGMEIALLTWPTENTTKSNYLKPSMYFSVSTDTKNPDAAVALLNYLINSEECNDILLGERGVPASTAIAASIKSKISETDQKAMDYVTDVITPNCSPIDPPNPEGWSEFSDTLSKLQESVGYGETTPEEAAKQLSEKAAELWGN